MFSKINNVSIAVVTSDPDVHLFFSCVFGEELNMQMYLDARIDEVLKNQKNFDYMIIDARTALKENQKGCWKKICDLFKNCWDTQTSLQQRFIRIFYQID